jgi:hypothetical protein
MKKLALLFALFALICATPVIAAEKALLGNTNIAIKVSHVTFTSGILKDLNIDTGVYVGIEGYSLISPALYLGGEIGYAKPDGQFSGVNVSATYIPIEANLKYVTKISPDLTLGLGGGIAYIFIDERASAGGYTLSESFWLLGGQVFADANYTSGKYFGGVNFKLQTTQEEGSGVNAYDYGNWKLGAQVGMVY